MQAAHEGYRALVEDNADAVIAQANAEVFALCLQPLEIGNILKGSGCFNLLDHALYSAQQPIVADGGQSFSKEPRKSVFTPRV
jgi:hypothetical protein